MAFKRRQRDAGTRVETFSRALRGEDLHVAPCGDEEARRVCGVRGRAESYREHRETAFGERERVRGGYALCVTQKRTLLLAGARARPPMARVGVPRALRLRRAGGVGAADVCAVGGARHAGPGRRRARPGLLLGRPGRHTERQRGGAGHALERRVVPAGVPARALRGDCQRVHLQTVEARARGRFAGRRGGHARRRGLGGGAGG
mmetsp:Transcript_14331/g.61446  ORF Transcript_14331/g.61446 Transcript_14331/m.61446 type:complete len:204 (-) Transcript_14331:893-1504(-)